MRLIKTSAAVLNQTPMDWAGNQRHILGAIESARQAGVSILCLPELCITGYGCEDAFHSSGTHQAALDVLHNILPATEGLIISVGLPVMHQNGIFNTACLIVNRNIAGFVAKRFLAGDGIHYEPRWFKAWPPGTIASILFNKKDYPLGDIHFDVGGIRIGFEICEDAWVANRPGRQLSLEGADIILNPSASHFAFGKADVRKRLVLEGSRAFGVTYIYSNLLGNESGRAIYDGGALIASGGKMVAQGQRFSFEDYQLITAMVDIDATRAQQARIASFTPQLTAQNNMIAAPFDYPAQNAEASIMPLDPWEVSAHLKEEEFTHAEALGLFDYLRKSRSNSFIVSLSGGADSSAVSCLITTMVALGTAELGMQGFISKLTSKAALKHARTARDIVRQLLTCVYQSTRNSTPTTRNAAQSLAVSLGAEFLEFNVDAIAQRYTDIVATAIGRTPDWISDDIALQNIQARVRAPGIWMLANLRNALLLATSNRSEAAVGYATMDGDTCGGLSPIAGIDKAFLRQWLRWMETTGPSGLRPIPDLSVVNCQNPTAELRPGESAQTDEDDLMPYDVLDAIERAAIRDKLAPIDVFRTLTPVFPQSSWPKMGFWIDRFFRLWCRNQWKRERYAPSFHLDDENLDPKTWCRFPILSGGFEQELQQLHDHIKSLN